MDRKLNRIIALVKLMKVIMTNDLKMGAARRTVAYAGWLLHAPALVALGPNAPWAGR
jgi:hypothetical protein